MIYIVVFLILSIIVIIQGYLVRRFGAASLVNNPFSLSLIFFEIIHLLVPLLQWNQSYFRYSNSYNEYTYIWSIILVSSLFFIYIIIFIFGFKYFFDLRRYFVFLDTRNSKKLLISTYFIFIIGLYFSFNNILNIQSVGVEDYLSDRVGFSAGAGYKTIFAHWVYISCILFYLGYLIASYKKLFLYSFIFSLVYCFLYYGVNSNRNSLFVLLLNLIIFYTVFSVSGKKKFLKNISMIICISFSLYIFYWIGKFRNTAFSKQQDDYGLVRSLNGAFGNHENIVWLISNPHNILLGKTYIASFLNLIPRALWLNKPYGAGPELKNMIYPGSYILGQEGNSSLTTGLFTEVLMNFGVLGSIPAIFFISVVVFMFLNYIKKMKHPIGLVLYIYLFVLLSSQFFYAEFLGFFTRTLFTCIPIILLAFFVKFERKYT